MSSRPLQYENLPTSEAFVFEEKVKNKKNITSHEHVRNVSSAYHKTHLPLHKRNV